MLADQLQGEEREKYAEYEGQCKRNKRFQDYSYFKERKGKGLGGSTIDLRL